MDALCSGRRNCSLHLPAQALDVTKPCPKEFKTFLQAKYECVRGKHPHNKFSIFKVKLNVLELSNAFSDTAIRGFITGPQTKQRPYSDLGKYLMHYQIWKSLCGLFSSIESWLRMDWLRSKGLPLGLLLSTKYTGY